MWNVSGFTVAGSASDGYGIYVNADYCTISDNNASEHTYGIYLSSSSNCVLENNNASSNGYWGSGICLHYSSNCTLTNNIASSNSYGIRLKSTSINNNIRGNTVSDNANYGMYLDWSGDNEIYHNNFIDNNKQAYDHNGFNSWDKGASVGGNYWSDHSCSGNPSDGTEPYNGIDTNAGAVDTYPFEEPDGWATAPPLFTTADAVIALQIAVGSRPPDLRWDVSGDDRVTSLDALMILQAAAGSIEIG
ncbi:MAG: NosD domain-containing protein [Euryarchaeota archaeon]|nr:NosD domain-containing protein [Euryarchaeota archaeon]